MPGMRPHGRSPAGPPRRDTYRAARARRRGGIDIAALRAALALMALAFAALCMAQPAHGAAHGEAHAAAHRAEYVRAHGDASLYSTDVAFAPSVTYARALRLVTDLGLQPAIGCGSDWQPMGERTTFAEDHHLLVEPGYLVAPDDWWARLAATPGVTAVQDAIPTTDQTFDRAVPTAAGFSPAGAPAYGAPVPTATPNAPASAFPVTYACPGAVASTNASSAVVPAGAPNIALLAPTRVVPGTTQSGLMARVTFAPWMGYDGALATTSDVGVGLADPCYEAAALQGAGPIWHPMGQVGAYSTARTLIVQTNSPISARDWAHRLWGTAAVLRIDTHVAASCPVPLAAAWLVPDLPDLVLVRLAALLASGLALLVGTLALGRALTRRWQALRWLGGAVPPALGALALVPLGVGAWTIVVAGRTLTLYQTLTCPACWPADSSVNQAPGQVVPALVGGLIALALCVTLLFAVPLVAAWGGAAPQNSGVLPMPILPRYGTAAPASGMVPEAMWNGAAPPALPSAGLAPGNAFRDTPPPSPTNAFPVPPPPTAVDTPSRVEAARAQDARPHPPDF